ncbi:MAG: hypothetical protein KJ645_11125 [Planctomycetes bacterium]|nr:hypothetical protein [Planctomycetota bacterium]
MDNPRWERVKELFDKAVSLQPHGLTLFWDSLSTEELELRADVEGLLEADSRTGDFMKPPPSSWMPAEEKTTDRIGNRIGQYVLKRIGETTPFLPYFKEYRNPKQQSQA